MAPSHWQPVTIAITSCNSYPSFLPTPLDHEDQRLWLKNVQPTMYDNLFAANAAHRYPIRSTHLFPPRPPRGFATVPWHYGLSESTIDFYVFPCYHTRSPYRHGHLFSHNESILIRTLISTQYMDPYVFPCYLTGNLYINSPVPLSHVCMTFLWTDHGRGCVNINVTIAGTVDFSVSP